MVSVLVAPELPGVTVAGWNEAVASGGSPVAESVTTPVNDPFVGCTATLNCAVPPGETVWGGVGELVLKSAGVTGATPVPLSIAV